ncbi:MAG: ABC transporter permease subunit [Cystobacter sp.]
MSAAPPRRRVLPGFGLTLGLSWSYLALIVLLPLSALFLKTFSLTWEQFWATVASPRVLAAYRLSFGAAFFAALVNTVFGLLVAWVLVRYRFPGRALVDALVDLPFALPTAVAGIALTFIGLPFVVRTVQPVLEELDADVEEAAATLGATPFRTFTHVLLPSIFPALLSGFTLAFARAIGEYGSVVFISGNMPMKTEIAPLLIITRLEQYDYAGATAIAGVMLTVSFALLLAVNLLQRWSHRRFEARTD